MSTRSIISVVPKWRRMFDAKENEKTSIEVPKVDEGSSVPIVFGKARVRRPVLAWSGEANRSTNNWTINCTWNVCIPFQDGITRITKVYFDDVIAIPTLSGLSLQPTVETGINNESRTYSPDTGESDYVNMTWVWSDGASDSNFATVPFVVAYMTVDPNTIPGWRGYVTVCATLFQHQTSLASVNFEVDSISPFPSHIDEPGPFFYVSMAIGDDANPADVIAAIICDRFGKLGQDPDEVLDRASFRSAAQALKAEGHGVSRSFEDRETAREMIDAICEQINATLYQEPSTGKWVLKLIRADYDPNTVPEINVANCVRIDSPSLGSWDNTYDRVRVQFLNREDGYRQGSGVDQNTSNALNGESREYVVSMPGITTQDLADKTATRVLQEVSRPLATMRAVVERNFWNVRPGSVVAMTWPELNISRRLFRIANESRGKPNESVIYLDLVEETFYVHRRSVFPSPDFAGMPGGGLAPG